jgi:hypothetical protein
VLAGCSRRLDRGDLARQYHFDAFPLVNHFLFQPRLTQAVGQAATLLGHLPFGSCRASDQSNASRGLPAQRQMRIARIRIASPLRVQRASPVNTRRFTAIPISVRSRALRTAALSYSRCPVLARADCCYADPAAPPNICCSRPPCLGDFSPPRMPTPRGGSHRSPRRAAAERHRSAALFRALLHRMLLTQVRE